MVSEHQPLSPTKLQLFAELCKKKPKKVDAVNLFRCFSATPPPSAIPTYLSDIARPPNFLKMVSSHQPFLAFLLCALLSTHKIRLTKKFFGWNPPYLKKISKFAMLIGGSNKKGTQIRTLACVETVCDIEN